MTTETKIVKTHETKVVKPAESIADRDWSEVVSVKNISKQLINTSQGSIKPNARGKATVAEVMNWISVLEEVKHE